MRVYADLFFLLNAGADYALLLTAARLCGIGCRGARLAGAAAFGGAYAVAALVLPVPYLFSPVGAAAAGCLMVVLAFWPRSLRVLARLIGCLYGAAALAAGLSLLLAQGAGAGMPLLALVLAVGGALLAGAAILDRLRGRGGGRIGRLEIAIAGRSACCRALIDSGCGLADPAGTGLAVVVSPAALRPLVPRGLLQALAMGPALLPAAIAKVAAAEDAGPAPPWAARLRLLPYRSLGVASGLVCGLRPDGLWLLLDGERLPLRAVVGISPGPLDPDQAFEALVPASLAQERPAPPPDVLVRRGPHLRVVPRAAFADPAADGQR